MKLRVRFVSSLGSATSARHCEAMVQAEAISGEATGSLQLPSVAFEIASHDYRLAMTPQDRNSQTFTLSNIQTSSFPWDRVRRRLGASLLAMPSQAGYGVKGHVVNGLR